MCEVEAESRWLCRVDQLMPLMHGWAGERGTDWTGRLMMDRSSEFKKSWLADGRRWIARFGLGEQEEAVLTTGCRCVREREDAL